MQLDEYELCNRKLGPLTLATSASLSAHYLDHSNSTLDLDLNSDKHQ